MHTAQTVRAAARVAGAPPLPHPLPPALLDDAGVAATLRRLAQLDPLHTAYYAHLLSNSDDARAVAAGGEGGTGGGGEGGA